jgi:hypothetical protein
MPEQSKKHLSAKHSIIEKANTTMLIAVGLTVFVVVFCLFATRSLLSLSFYQQKVISEKDKALDQLEENKKNVEDLRLVYTSFKEEPINVIGGAPEGTGPRDGDNVEIVLDSLPTDYNFPALSSSVEKILKDGGYSISSIGGRETPSSEEVSSNPVPVEIPYSFAVRGTTDSVKGLVSTLERSIRPIYVRSLQIRAADTGLSAEVGFVTYYSAEKTFDTTTKVVK